MSVRPQEVMRRSVGSRSSFQEAGMVFILRPLERRALLSAAAAHERAPALPPSGLTVTSWDSSVFVIPSGRIPVLWFWNCQSLRVRERTVLMFCRGYLRSPLQGMFEKIFGSNLTRLPLKETRQTDKKKEFIAQKQ